jgi:hypothetical protein
MATISFLTVQRPLVFAVGMSKSERPKSERPKDNGLDVIHRADAEARKLHAKMIKIKAEKENKRNDALREIAITLDGIAKTESDILKKSLVHDNNSLKNDQALGFHVPDIVVGQLDDDEDSDIEFTGQET